MFQEENKTIKLFEKTRTALKKRLQIYLGVLLLILSTLFIFTGLMNGDVFNVFFNIIIFSELILSLVLVVYVNIRDRKSSLFILPRRTEDFLRDVSLTTRAMYLEKFYKIENMSFEEAVYFLGLTNQISRESNMTVLTNLLNLKIINDPTKDYLKVAVLERITALSSEDCIDGKSDVEVLEKALLKLKEKNKIEKSNVSIITNE